jgi:cholinesterase
MIEFIGTLGNDKNRTARWFKVSEKAGCGGVANTSGEASLECMRGKPWKDIMAAIKPAGITTSAGGLGKIRNATLR